MGKNSKKIYDEEDEELDEPVEQKDSDISLADLAEEIDNYYDNQPKDKRSKLYKAWVEGINKKMDRYNKVAKFKAFRLIK